MDNHEFQHNNNIILSGCILNNEHNIEYVLKYINMDSLYKIMMTSNGKEAK